MDTNESLQARIERVRFQTSAAAIQYRLTDTLLCVQQLLDELFEVGRPWERGRAQSRALSARYSECTVDWSFLDAPEVLRPEWSALSGVLEGVRPLFDELALLETQTPGRSRQDVIRLQKAFMAEIDKMNRIERRLLAKEQEFSGA